jgi:uncharacterized protein
MTDRRPFFLDTAYVEAGVNARDQWHAAAARWERYLAVQRRRLLTTEYVLVEIANGLAAPRHRSRAVDLIRRLIASPNVEIVPASADLFRAALELYENRPDKDWGLTDCASFVVMADRGLTDAFTIDDHFRQAGFRPLLLDDPPAA